MRGIMVITCLVLLNGFFSDALAQSSNSTVVKRGAKYDTIIRKHTDKPTVKKVVKPVTAQVTAPELILPTPEFMNQPYYYDPGENKLIRLETTTAQLVTKKKTLGLKGAKQFFSMDGTSSKVRF